jgi:hypothetical protein
LTGRSSGDKNEVMKISQLLQVVLASAFMAAPGLAASPSVGSDTPVSLCGGDKAEKTEKAEDSDAPVKSEKKNEKKESKDQQTGTKGSA